MCLADLYSVRWNEVLLHTISAKWRSGKWCFGKTMFGWTTIRENDVRLNDDSEKSRSAFWSFANSTIQPYEDSVKWLSAIFFRQNNHSVKSHFDKTTIRWNDVSGKWCGSKKKLQHFTCVVALFLQSYSIFCQFYFRKGEWKYTK